MGFIGSIISDLASIITIVTLWGISANSPLLLKIAVVLVSVLLSVGIIVWHHRRKYKVKGYSRDKNDNSKVAYMLIPNSRKLQMDTLVSVYVRYEEEIELVAIGALSESADKSGRYVQVNIEHRINDELLSKIMQNDRMKKRYFIEDTVRFSDISDLMK